MSASSSLPSSSSSSSSSDVVRRERLVSGRTLLAIATAVVVSVSLVRATIKRRQRMAQRRLSTPAAFMDATPVTNDEPTVTTTGSITPSSDSAMDHKDNDNSWLTSLTSCEDTCVDITIDTTNKQSLSISLYRLCYTSLWCHHPSLPSYARAASVPSSLGAPPKEFTYRPIHGGITNQLYLCEMRGVGNVLVRVYGAMTEEVIDRDRENLVVNYLSRQRFGPRILGRGVNARLEQWLPTVHCLKPDQMMIAPISSAIAHRISLLHAMKVPLDRSASLWITLTQWMNKALSVNFDDSPTKNAIYQSLGLNNIRHELSLLRDGIASDSVAAASPIVFCHNDLLCGNLLLEPADGSITLVDFEYGCYSYRAFDIANHFCECCGFDCNWDMFPSREQQLNFCRAYLSSSSSSPRQSDDQLAAAASSLVDEVRPYILASHLFWGLWAVVQARYSVVQFDYISYSKLRLDAYASMRSSYWPTSSPLVASSTAASNTTLTIPTVDLATTSSAGASVTLSP